jgi:hypothetical protein
MTNRRLVWITCAIAVTALVATAVQAASSMTHTNYLTFSGPVALPGVTLAAGTYTFETSPADTDPNIVRVLTRNGRQVLYTGFTTPVARPSGRVPVVVFGEALAGRPMPIRVWYPTQSSIGHQFRH